MIEDSSLHPHCETQGVRIIVSIRFGLFDVSTRVVELVVICKQPYQGEMIPEYCLALFEGGRDLKGGIVMVNRFLFLALESTYLVQSLVALADPKVLALPLEESRRTKYGFFRGIELSDCGQPIGEENQTAYMLRIADPFVNPQILL